MNCDVINLVFLWPAMNVAGTNPPQDNLELAAEYKNYSRVPICPNSRSDSSTESNGPTNSTNNTIGKPVSIISSTSSSICRICQDVDKTENLKTLCQCTGSIAKYHVSCLEKWLSVSKTDRCELCHQSFITKRKPRPFCEWVRWVHGTAQGRYIYGDFLCLIILTPLVLVSGALCFEGSWYYFALGQLMIATGLVTLCVFLVFLYVLWIVLSARYHLNRWHKWRQENQIVKVVVPDSKSRGKHFKQKQQEQETIV